MYTKRQYNNESGNKVFRQMEVGVRQRMQIKDGRRIDNEHHLLMKNFRKENDFSLNISAKTALSNPRKSIVVQCVNCDRIIHSGRHKSSVDQVIKDYGSIDQCIKQNFRTASFYNNGSIVKIDLPNLNAAATSDCLIMSWDEDDYSVFHLGPLQEPKPRDATTAVQTIYDEGVKEFLKRTKYSSYLDGEDNNEEEEKKAESNIEQNGNENTNDEEFPTFEQVAAAETAAAAEGKKNVRTKHSGKR